MHLIIVLVYQISHQSLQTLNNMYLRIIDETINYPYSIPQLRAAFPNVSLPAELTDTSLIEWDMYVVTPTTIPNDYTKNITEGTPVLTDGLYYQNWIQTNASQSEIDYRLENQWFIIRETRNELLVECDWTQLGDVSAETKAIWSEYRQSLRDITSQTNPFSINWPVKP
jgi:hypothetical protein